jgi:hypothetical protein
VWIYGDLEDSCSLSQAKLLLSSHLREMGI